MSGKTYYGNQAVFTWRGSGWTPLRGIHRGRTCAVCGLDKQTMYERDGRSYCPEHRDAGRA